MANQKELLTVAKEAALLGSKILLKYQKKLSTLTVESKKAQGVVSEADRETENAIMAFLRKRHPDISFLGEESSFIESESSRDSFEQYKEEEWCWCIDPLDGTHNYLNGLEYYCISIALLHFGAPVLGVIYRPVTGECYWATKSLGAFYQNSLGKKVRLDIGIGAKKLADSLVVTGFSSEKGVMYPDEVERFARFLSRSRGVRRLGSAALDLCLVARGVFDGFWEKELAPWDVAAGALIASEAGAKVSDWQGKSFHPFQRSIVAAKPTLYGQMKKLL